MVDSLGNRMKENYENISKTRLTRRMPVIIRIDGKAFHTFCRGFEKPFDYILMSTMKDVTLELCKNIQNAKLGYCQSDEISILLCDYDNFDTSAWFDNEVQKICSISASMTTFYFNKIFGYKVNDFSDSLALAWNVSEREQEYERALWRSVDKGAMFDSRCFNIPKEEVTNYFLWRQQDATRNSIQMTGQYYFKHKELQKKSCDEIQNMLLVEKDVNWNDFSTDKKRGTCCIKTEKGWIIDNNIPIFKNEGRNYIEKLI